MSDFEVLQLVGEGNFSQVFKIQNRVTKKIYALKKQKKEGDPSFVIEVRIMKALGNHPNIINLISVLENNDIITDLMDMNLFQFMRRYDFPIPEEKALNITKQILSGLSYIHSKHIYHRDMKPENIMINRQSLEVKIGDFGSADFISTNPRDHYVITRYYRPPEVLLNAGYYDEKVDVFGVGCILFEMMRTRPLFAGRNSEEQLEIIHKILGTPDMDTFETMKRYCRIDMELTFPVYEPSNLHSLLPRASDKCIDLLHCLIEYSPLKRISAEAALKHPAFTQPPPKVIISPKGSVQSLMQIPTRPVINKMKPPIHRLRPGLMSQKKVLFVPTIARK